MNINDLPVTFKNDIETALKIFKQFGVTDVYLFGSLSNGKYNEKSDIDFAVKGLKNKYFFKVGGQLMGKLNNEFDLVDLDSKKSDFAKMLLESGRLVKID